jgi:hypothetical protein
LKRRFIAPVDPHFSTSILYEFGLDFLVLLILPSLPHFTMEENSAIRLPRLKAESNWNPRYIAFMSALRSEGLDDYFDVTEIEPVKQAGESDADFSKRMKERKKNNGQVTTIVHGRVDSTITVSLGGYIIAKDMVDYLKSLYQPLGISYRYSIHQKYTELPFDGKVRRANTCL